MVPPAALTLTDCRLLRIRGYVETVGVAPGPHSSPRRVSTLCIYIYLYVYIYIISLFSFSLFLSLTHSPSLSRWFYGSRSLWLKIGVVLRAIRATDVAHEAFHFTRKLRRRRRRRARTDRFRRSSHCPRSLERLLRGSRVYVRVRAVPSGICVRYANRRP